MNNNTETPVAQGFGTFQFEIDEWMKWNSQSSEYKLKHPEPPKPKGLEL